MICLVDKKEILEKIVKKGELSAADICKELGADIAEVKKICKQLEEEELVSRYHQYYEGDGLIIEITDKGREFLNKKLDKMPGKKR